MHQTVLRPPFHAILKAFRRAAADPSACENNRTLRRSSVLLFCPPLGPATRSSGHVWVDRDNMGTSFHGSVRMHSRLFKITFFVTIVSHAEDFRNRALRIDAGGEQEIDLSEMDEHVAFD